MPVEMRQCNICGHITERDNLLDHIIEAHGYKTIEVISTLVDKNINIVKKSNKILSMEPYDYTRIDEEDE